MMSNKFYFFFFLFFLFPLVSAQASVSGIPDVDMNYDDFYSFSVSDYASGYDDISTYITFVDPDTSQGVTLFGDTGGDSTNSYFSISLDTSGFIQIISYSNDLSNQILQLCVGTSYSTDDCDSFMLDIGLVTSSPPQQIASFADLHLGTSGSFTYDMNNWFSNYDTITVNYYDTDLAQTVNLQGSFGDSFVSSDGVIYSSLSPYTQSIAVTFASLNNSFSDTVTITASNSYGSVSSNFTVSSLPINAQSTSYYDLFVDFEGVDLMITDSGVVCEYPDSPYLTFGGVPYFIFYDYPSLPSLTTLCGDSTNSLIMRSVSRVNLDYFVGQNVTSIDRFVIQGSNLPYSDDGINFTAYISESVQTPALTAFYFNSIPLGNTYASFDQSFFGGTTDVYYNLTMNSNFRSDFLSAIDAGDPYFYFDTYFTVTDYVGSPPHAIQYFGLPKGYMDYNISDQLLFEDFSTSPPQQIASILPISISGYDFTSVRYLNDFFLYGSTYTVITADGDSISVDVGSGSYFEIDNYKYIITLAEGAYGQVALSVTSKSYSVSELLSIIVTNSYGSVSYDLPITIVGGSSISSGINQTYSGGSLYGGAVGLLSSTFPDSASLTLAQRIGHVVVTLSIIMAICIIVGYTVGSLKLAIMLGLLVQVGFFLYFLSIGYVPLTVLVISFFILVVYAYWRRGG